MDDKNELLARIDGLKELINTKFAVNEDSHNAIFEQVKKTNGRVTSLEEWRNQLLGASNLIKVLGIGNIIVWVVFTFKIFIK